ncbi:MAG: glycosyltransferase [Acidobacteria bacterium]|nr:MAG: glycosyltransferase [Acidobacteriota bacterium]MCE7956739.1 glycosyltransferase [Acidobacteria bacterium ACB2]
MSSRAVRISILTAVRDGARTVGDCLASVRGQTVPIEHVVVDGASTDGTLDLLRTADGVARLVSEPDGGIYDAMNKGIGLATGEVVGTLNADDVYAAPDVLAEVAGVFEDPSAEACYGDLEYVDRDDVSRVRRRWVAGPFRRESFLRGWMPPHPTFFVRRRVYESLGRFRTDLGSAADYELMLRFLYRHGIKAVYIPRVLVRMRTGGASNRSLLARVRANRMDREAWRVNDLKPGLATLLLKPLRKLPQFLGVVALVGVAALCALRAAPAAGQVVSGGGVIVGSAFRLPGEGRVMPTREQLAGEVQSARWHLGPVGIRPRLSLSNFGYSNNFFGTTEDEKKGDWQATLGGGLTATARLASVFWLRDEFNAGYNWYLENADRRGIVYDNQLFGYVYVGRFTWELGGSRYQTIQNLSSEVEQPVTETGWNGLVRGEYAFSDRTAAVGSVDATQRKYSADGTTPEDEAALKGLDGTDLTFRIGIRQRIRSKLAVGLEYENAKYTFVETGALRDSRSDGLIATVTYEGRLGVGVSGGYRNYKAVSGSSFPGWDGLTGGANLRYQVVRPLSVFLYGITGLTNSLYADNAFFIEDRYGAGLGLSVWQIQVAGAYETGANRYQVPTVMPDGSELLRKDDVETLRGSIGIPILRWLRITADISRKAYTSNVPGEDRTILEARTNVQIGQGLQIF